MSGLAPVPYTILTAVSSLGVSVLTFVIIHPSGLIDDDFTNLRFVKGAHSFISTLFVPVFYTQVSPGHRLLTALQLYVGPLDRVVMHALLAALTGTAVVLGAVIMRRLYGRQPWAPVIIALALLGPAAIKVNLWYAAAFHQIPALVFGLSAVVAYLKYRDDADSGRWLVASVLLVATGLLFSVRLVLAVVFLILLEHVLLREEDGVATLRSIWQRRHVWAWYVVAVGFYWAMGRAGGLPVSGEITATLEATMIGYIELFVPMLFGVGTAGAHADVLRGSGPLVAGHALVVAFVVFSVKRRRRAWRGIAVAAAIVVVGVALAAAPRVPGLGLGAALAPRYYLAPLVYALFGLPWGFRGELDEPTAPVVRRLSGRSGQALTGALLLTVAASSWFSIGAQVSNYPGIASARWLEAVETSVAAKGFVKSLDVPLAPETQENFPHRRLNDIAFLYENLEVASTPPVDVITPEGNVEPLDAREIFRQSGADYSENGLVHAQGDFEVRGSSVCTASTMRFDAVFARHPLPRLLFVEISGPARLDVDMIPLAGAVREPSAQTTTPREGGEVLLPMDLFGATAEARLHVAARMAESVCIEEVAFLEVHNQLPATELGAG